MRRDLFIILFIALAANVAYLISSNGDYTFPDSKTYIAPARYLIRGEGFISEPEVPETIRTPVYPILLIPFLGMSASLVPIVLAQHILAAMLAAAIYLFLLRRLQSRIIAIVAALLFALDTPTIHYANKVLTETTFTIALFAVFVLALRGQTGKSALHVCAVLCGVLVLLRPVAIVWFAPLALYFLWRGIGWRRVAAFAVLSAALPLAWAARNYAQTGVFTVSSVAQTNLLMYRAAGAVAIDEGDEFKPGLMKAQNELLAEADAIIRDEEHVASRFDLPHAVQSKYFARVARETIAQNKMAFAQLTVRGLLVNLADSDWESMMMVSWIYSDIVKLLINFENAAVILLSIIGLVILWKRDRELAVLIAITAGYFIAISAGGEAEARFRVPVMPQIVIAAAVAIDVIRRAVVPAPR